MKMLFDFITALFEILFNGLFFLLKEIGMLTKNIFKSEKPVPAKYSAKFEDPGMAISRWNKGFMIGSRALTRKASLSNMLAIGPSGTGKTASIAANFLFKLTDVEKAPASVVINTPSGDLLNIAGPRFEQVGMNVLVLDLENPELSNGFNPLSRIGKEGNSIQQFAHTFMRLASGTEPKDPFWLNSSSSLLTLCITILLHFPEEHFHLTNVRQLLLYMSGDAKMIDHVVVKIKSEQLFTDYKAFLSISENTRQSIIANALAALQSLNDPGISTITSYNSIPIENLRKQNLAIFILSPSLNTSFNSVLTSLFCEQAYNYLLSNLPKKEDNSVFFVLDEFSSIQIQALPQALSVQRKYNVGSLLLTQSFDQIEHAFGKNEAANILANCGTKVYLGNQPAYTAQALEKQLGLTEFEENGKVFVRPLMTAQDIQRMKDQALCFSEGRNPCLLPLQPYYKMRFNKYTKLPPIERPIQRPLGQISLLTKEVMLAFQSHG